MAGWKTIIFNVLAGAVVIAGMFGFDMFTLDPEVETFLVVVVNMALRFVTKTPVFNTQP